MKTGTLVQLVRRYDYHDTTWCVTPVQGITGPENPLILVDAKVCGMVLAESGSHDCYVGPETCVLLGSTYGWIASRFIEEVER